METMLLRSSEGAARFLIALLVGLAITGCSDNGDPDEISASGWLEAVAVDVAPSMAGRVARVAVAEGDRVEAGAVLVELDPALVDAQVEDAAAAADLAAAERDRLVSAPPSHEVDAARAALAAALAALDGTRTGGQVAAAGTSVAPSAALPSSPDAETALRRAEADVDAAEARLEGLLAGADEAAVMAADARVEQALAALDAARSQRDAMTLRSPVAGVVLTRAVQPGEVVRPGATAVRVADLADLTVVLYVPEDDIHRVELGDRAELDVGAMPDETFEGRVVRVSRRPEFSPRSAVDDGEDTGAAYAVEVKVPNPDGRLRPGLSATVRVEPSDG
jgi:HlyD family secretion protein